uniref:CSON012715 protein n=1 Tax=Culicoides sonorensis TaxID=179676 RepID=A0A336KKD1_CULSO
MEQTDLQSDGGQTVYNSAFFLTKCTKKLLEPVSLHHHILAVLSEIQSRIVTNRSMAVLSSIMRVFPIARHITMLNVVRSVLDVRNPLQDVVLLQCLGNSILNTSCAHFV